MKLVNADQMRAIDDRAINVEKIPSLELMENAGRGIFEYIKENIIPQFDRPNIAVICGRGNNGGDGFVVGRHLIDDGWEVDFYLVGDDEKLSDDCRVNYNHIRDAGHGIVHIIDEPHLPDLSEYNIIVDAIFGTGFSGAPRGISEPVIERINDANRFVVAVDAPSGLDVSTGAAEGAVVMADITTTLALPKPGQFVSPGRELCGNVVVIPIGIPAEVVDHFDLKSNLIMSELVSSLLPIPKSDGHKGNFGKVFVLAGSPGLTGAATMSGLAAARSGAGLVTVGVPASLNHILEVKLTEVMTVPLPEDKRKSVLAVRGIGQIRQLIAERDAAAIGPGIGRHHETIELIQRLIPSIDVPAVIDADGLFALSKDNSPLLADHAPLVLTPHPGEFARLTGETPDANQINNYDLAVKYARAFNSVIVLKGSPTIVASPDGEVFLNPTGNWGMATGGSGDVLTGIILALLGQGLDPMEAAVCGVYVHGLAGDLATEEIHPRSMIAGDLIEYLSDAFDAVEFV